MSFPGPVGGAANLACDTGLQRATDQFNFVVDSGGAEPAPTVPSNLQSPATVIPDGAGDSRLTIAGTPGNSGNLSIQGQISYISLQSIKLFASSAATHTMVINASADGSDVPLAGFDYTNDVITLGKPAFGGTVTLNSDTTINGSTTISNGLAISDSAGGTNQLILSPLSASTSQIIQDPTGAGTLNLGTSSGNPDIISLRDTGAANTGSVVIGGNGGNSILFTPSINNAAAAISTDRAPGNTGVLTIGGSVGAPAVQFSDSGTAFTQNVQTAINTTLTIGGDINMGTDGVIRNYANYVTAFNAAIGSGISVTINSTNPPPNGIGLYCVTIYAPSDITANVSGVAFWDGSLWRGGSTGNAAYRIQTAANFQSLTFFNTSGTTMNGSYATNVYQILGPTTS